MSPDIVFDTGIILPEVLHSGRFTAEIAPERLRLSLRVKPKDRAAIAKALGISLPAKTGATSSKAGLISACLGPDEWLVIADKDTYANLYETALKLSQKYVMSAADISHRNVALTVTGEGAAEVVNVGCPLDLSLDAFPKGKCTRTIYESAPVMLYRSAPDSFTLECWRSFAPYVVSLMAAHARGA